MTRRTSAAILATGLILAPTAALADEPTFQVTLTPPGIQLLNGDVFEDNGHLNVHTTTGTYNFHFEGKCVTRTDAECAGQRHQVAQYIGRDWFPLGEFIPNLGCVLWVQKSGHDFHYAAPCGTPSPTPSSTSVTPTPEPSPTSTVTPTPEPTATPTPTVTPEPTPEPTQTPTPSETPTPLPTATGTPTPSGTPLPTATEGVGPTPQYTERPGMMRRLAESGGKSGYGLALLGAVLIAAGLGLYQRNRRKA